jgi:hypothetical protein
MSIFFHALVINHSKTWRILKEKNQYGKYIFKFKNKKIIVLQWIK